MFIPSSVHRYVQSPSSQAADLRQPHGEVTPRSDFSEVHDQEHRSCSIDEVSTAIQALWTEARPVGN